jgi:hypothetical protein
MLGKDCQRAQIFDVSSTGIRLILPPASLALKQGMTVSIVLMNKPHGFGRVLCLRVAHHAIQPDGNFIVGGAFETLLSKEEMHALLEDGIK